MELHGLQRVDDGGGEALGEGEGGVVLGIAADLQHALAELGEGHRQIRRGRALADAALAVDGEDLGCPNVEIGIKLDLHGAGGLARYRISDRNVHAAISVVTPSRRSSSSSPAVCRASSKSGSGVQ